MIPIWPDSARRSLPSFPSVHKNPIRETRVIRDLQVFCIFPRNEPPNPAKYSGERPELSSQQREITERQNKKEKLEYE